MFRFELNDNLKQYIKEVEILKNKVDIVRDYLRELEYKCDITINIGDFKMVLPGFLVIPDWEAKCFRITRKGKSSESDESFKALDDMLDLKNQFNIPFKMVLEGHVEFITSRYGHMDITSKFVELIEQAYGDMAGYRYEFIKEAWDDPSHDTIYNINGIYYTAYLTSSAHNPTAMLLDLKECQTGQSHYVTALELLRGKYSYVHELDKTVGGLYIPRLCIKKYKCCDKVNPTELFNDSDKCEEE